MYLLDTKTLTLIRNDYDSGVHKEGRLQYAILSHTWGEGEVTFEDIQDLENAKLKKGFAKIQGACRLADTDGFCHIWIDTCCIDKSSSAELSEAINAMYSYYHDADVCYTYLSDLQSENDLNDPSLDFRQCAWFKRGWTLQELIAPLTVIFYAQDWKEIGTKSSLHEIITRITNIPTEILLMKGGDGLVGVSIAQRMSWAGHRNTTRVEDEAYCLMGLFGVNMPIIYGEGPRAFKRLQLEIMRLSDDQSLFAWDHSVQTEDHYDGGLLANAARDYRECSSIIAPATQISADYLMTNRGLRIQLPVIEIHPLPDSPEKQYLAFLNCNQKYGENYYPKTFIVATTGEKKYRRLLSDHPSMFHKTYPDPSYLPKLETLQKFKLTDMLFPGINPIEFPFAHDRRQRGMCEFWTDQGCDAKITFIDIIAPAHSQSDQCGIGSIFVSANAHAALQFEHQNTAFVVILGYDGLTVWCDVFVNNGRSYSTIPTVKDSNYIGSKKHAGVPGKDRVTEKLDEYRTVTITLRRMGSNTRVTGSTKPRYAVRIEVNDTRGG